MKMARKMRHDGPNAASVPFAGARRIEITEILL